MLFALLSVDNQALAPLARQIIDTYYPAKRYIIMGAILMLSTFNFWQRRWNAYQIATICFAIFLVLTPGFGVQYLVYMCSLLLASDIKWGAVYSTLAGIFVAVIYYTFLDPTIPFSLFTSSFPMPSPLFGVLVWMLLVQILLLQLRRAGGETA